MGKYEVGSKVRSTAIFTDPNNSDAAIDPTAVLMNVKPPTGDLLSYTYGVGADIVKDSVGNYHLDIDITESGLWRHRWYSTGTGQASNESSFIVDKLDTVE